MVAVGHMPAALAPIIQLGEGTRNNASHMGVIASERGPEAIPDLLAQCPARSPAVW
jgi:hypothetical protein